MLAIAAVIINYTAPASGDFWWSDAPRHALNGIFVKDALVDLPFADPMHYATEYYLKYPALTILFYPPLFYIVSAPFYLVFGDSNAVAQAVVSLHYFALGVGTFALGRLWWRWPLALAAALLLMGLPEITLWGRQVMLEIPMMAFLVWSAYALLRYGREGRPRWLYIACVLFLLALYTKLTAAFLAPAIALYLLRVQGLAIFRSRAFWLSAVLLAVGALPLIGITLLFGQANIQSVAGVADAPASRLSLEGWLWYAQRLPQMLGWLPLGLGLVYWSRRALRHPTAVPRKEQEFLAAWFVGGYVLLSAISLKEARHATLLLIPVAIWAISAFEGIGSIWLRRAAAAACAASVLIYGIVYCPVPWVDGYREAAKFIAARAPHNSVIVFSGKRDGSFIFNMRTETGRNDLWTIRSDKLFLTVAVRRQLGVKQKDLSEAEIRRKLQDVGARYVVAQRDFWVDLPVMKRFQNVLDSDAFQEIARIPVHANVPTADKELRIYRTRLPIKDTSHDLTVDLSIIGRTLSGTTGEK